MAKRLFDTSVLIRHWRRRAADDQNATTDVVQRWARELIELHGTDAIVSPVLIVFLCGTTSSYELELARAYLAAFQVIDQLRTPPEDWKEAQRLAQRVPRDGQRRQLGDCLIRAIANRLKHDVISHDQGFV